LAVGDRINSAEMRRRNLIGADEMGATGRRQVHLFHGSGNAGAAEPPFQAANRGDAAAVRDNSSELGRWLPRRFATTLFRL
jgi:hypothetical protein